MSYSEMIVQIARADETGCKSGEGGRVKDTVEAVVFARDMRGDGWVACLAADVLNERFCR